MNYTFDFKNEMIFADEVIEIQLGYAEGGFIDDYKRNPSIRLRMTI